MAIKDSDSVTQQVENISIQLRDDRIKGNVTEAFDDCCKHKEQERKEVEEKQRQKEKEHKKMKKNLNCFAMHLEDRSSHTSF